MKSKAEFSVGVRRVLASETKVIQSSGAKSPFSELDLWWHRLPKMYPGLNRDIDNDKLGREVERRALQQSNLLKPSDVLSNLMSAPSSLGDEVARDLVAGGLSQERTVKAVLDGLALLQRSPAKRELAESALHHVVAGCATAVDPDISDIREWLVEQVFLPRNIPCSSDSRRLKRQIAFVGETSLNIHIALASACVADGQVVLVPRSSWGSFYLLGDYCDGRVVPVDTDSQYHRLSPEALQRTIKELPNGERPGMLVLTNPTNPSGYSYSAEELREIGLCCIRQKIVLLVDELYSGMAIKSRGRPDVHAAGLTVEVDGNRVRLYDHIVTAWGSSKLFGVASSPVGVALSGNENLIAQISEGVALNGRGPLVGTIAVNDVLMRERLPHLPAVAEALNKGHGYFMELLRKTNAEFNRPLLHLMHDPHAGMYATIGVSLDNACRFGVRTHLQFAEYLASALGIVTTPVQSMQVDSPDFLFCRLNFVTVKPEDMTQAFERLERWGKQLEAGNVPRVSLEF